MVLWLISVPENASLSIQVTPSDATAVGIVSDVTTGRGLALTLLTLTDAAGVVRHEVSGANGSFRFDGLPSGRYRLLATRPGYLSMAYGAASPEMPGPSVVLAAGKMAADLSIGLVRASAIAGRVIREDGQGLSSVDVVAVRSDSVLTRKPVEYRTVTDSQGAYRLGGVSPGEYFLAATARGSAQDQAGQSREEEIDWLLQQLRRGVRNGFKPWTGRSSVDRLTIAGTTYYPGTRTVAAAGNVRVEQAAELGGIDIVSRRSHAPVVHGLIEAAQGYKLALAEAKLIPRHSVLRRAGYSGVALPSQGFEVVFGAVAPGPYVVVARGTVQGPKEGLSEGPLWAVLDIEVPAAERYDVRIVVRPPTKLTGQVTDHRAGSGLATAGWRVVLGPWEPWLEDIVAEASATSDAVGRFEFDGLPPIRYAVNVSHDQIRQAGWRPVSAVSSAVDVFAAGLTVAETAGHLIVTVTDEDARLEGRLQTPTRLNASDFRVLVFPSRPDLRTERHRVAEVSPDETGSYRVRGLPAGDYMVGVLAGPAGSQLITNALMELVAPSSVPVTLRAGAVVRQDIAIGGTERR